MVLPILNYASTVWSPFYNYEINKLESVQHFFLRYLAWKSGSPMDWRDHDYSEVMPRFKIPTLESVRLKFDARLAFNIINELIALISDLFMTRNIPYNLRRFRKYNEAIGTTPT